MPRISPVKLTIMVAGFGMAFSSWALAVPPTDSKQVTVSFTNQAAISLTVQFATRNFNTINPSMGEQTIAQSTTVKSNTIWSLAVKGDGNFSDGGNTIPIGRLSHTTSTTDITMTLADQSLETAQAVTASKTDNWTYKLNILWTDAVGTGPYSTTITYTATGS